MSKKINEVSKVTPKIAFINDFMASNPDYTAALAAWAENRGEVGTGFKAEFYAELEKGPMTAAELDGFLVDRSPNVVKNKANWDGVRKMANRIWEARS
jgi:hypothetical protein